MPLTPGSKLGPYEILAPIGAGGMGEVWKARDTRLDRIVAIKKVREQHSERFKQEARSIAALNHPNICQLHDIGEDYLVLEYVEGKPLSSPLPEKETVRLAIQIATALEEAHQKGIIHRDLKPSNIMVTDKGSVKLLDFGLAKLYEQQASAGTASVLPALSTSPTVDFPPTQSGAVLGTIAYMSPEQAQGQPADARSDIFSFGLVLYEMLNGKRAFKGDSTPVTMAALLRDEPPPLKASPLIEKIVMRCLAKKPADRFQSMTEARNALEQIETKSAEQPPPSIAVLPFVNMSDDKEQEYFSDGLAEEIINALAQIPGLRVIARTSAFAFKGKQEDIRKIAEVLGVTNILEGSVRKAGHRIRVTAQLITADDGSHLWSERYDRDMTDVFVVQDEISQAIAGKLRLHLSENHPRAKRYTGNIEAYNLYLKGRYHFLKVTPESVVKAKEYYEQAIEKDPYYALPWFGLALFHWMLGYMGFMPAKAANEKCLEAAVKALELDELLPEARSLIGVLKVEQYDWYGAEREFRRALELGPKAWEVWMHYGIWYLAPMQRLDEAVAAMKKAVDLDPLSPITHTTLALAYYMNRQYDQAIQQCHTALELDPHYAGAHMYLGITLLRMDKYDEGLQAVQTCVQLQGRSPLYLGGLGLFYGLATRGDEARKVLAKLQELDQTAYVPSISFAQIYLGLGEIEKCLDCLEKAVDDQDSMISLYCQLPDFDPLRSQPRYQALLRKMNL